MTEAARRAGSWRGLSLAAVPALCVFVSGGATAAETRLADSWIAMVEACVRLAETGSRDVFAGWDIAFDGGGVCNGDPACEDDDMTFVAPDPLGTGAVTVRVGAADWVGRRYFGGDPVETEVGSFPAHTYCGSASGVRHRTSDLTGTTHETWVLRQRIARRLVPAVGYVSLAAGPYVGCGYDGRRYLVEFSLARPGPAVVRMNYPSRSGARGGETCAGAVS